MNHYLIYGIKIFSNNMCSQKKFLIFIGYGINSIEISCKKLFRYVTFMPFSISWQEREKRVWRDAFDWVNLKIVAKRFLHIWKKFPLESMFSEGSISVEMDRAWGAISHWHSLADYTRGSKIREPMRFALSWTNTVAT